MASRLRLDEGLAAGLLGLGGGFTPPVLDLTAASLVAKAQIRTLGARLRIADLTKLETALTNYSPLDVPHKGVHFARLVILRGATHLLLEVVYDDCRRVALDYLVGNGAALDAVLRHCVGYPTNAAFKRSSLKGYLNAHRVKARLFYRAYRWSEPSIEAGLALRDRFLRLIREWEAQGDGALPALYAQFLVDITQAPLPAANAPPPAMPVFDPHATNTLNMVHAIRDGLVDNAEIQAFLMIPDLGPLIAAFGLPISHLDLFKLLLASGWLQDKLDQDALTGLGTLHFARVSLIDKNTQPKMLFASIYDGDFLQYVLDFGTRVAPLVDLIWGRTVGYPKSCLNTREFVRWLNDGSTPARACHIGHRRATRLEVSASAELRVAVLEFVATHAPTAANLADDLRTLVKDEQGLLS